MEYLTSYVSHSPRPITYSLVKYYSEILVKRRNDYSSTARRISTFSRRYYIIRISIKTKLQFLIFRLGRFVLLINIIIYLLVVQISDSKFNYSQSTLKSEMTSILIMYVIENDIANCGENVKFDPFH